MAETTKRKLTRFLLLAGSSADAFLGCLSLGIIIRAAANAILIEFRYRQNVYKITIFMFLQQQQLRRRRGWRQHWLNNKGHIEQGCLYETDCEYVSMGWRSTGQSSGWFYILFQPKSFNTTTTTLAGISSHLLTKMSFLLVHQKLDYIKGKKVCR